jgi:hypothetical protein
VPEICTRILRASHVARCDRSSASPVPAPLPLPCRVAALPARSRATH